MNSRAAAASVLHRVLVDRKSLTLALDESLPAIPQENDRAFVQAMSFGVLRWYDVLDAALKKLATRPIRDEDVRLLALLGIYQLHYTRVKPHAAVAETVAAAGKRTWAKPFLNGVLRSFQREGEALMAQIESNADLSAAHPQWLRQRIRKEWPEQAAEILSQANRQAPLTLRVNRRQSSRDAYLTGLSDLAPMAMACTHSPDGIILPEPLALERLPGFAEGTVSVQDEAAQLAAHLLDPHPGHRVLDVCAAPGGKTQHLLETCPALSELVAVDLSPERLGRVRENLARANLVATVRAGDAADPHAWWDGRPFDRILLDAPCSATGVIRRHPDIKHLRQPGDIAQLAATQRRILDAIWPLLAPGGVLLYATCSIFRAENTDQIAAFLDRTPDAREVVIEAAWGHAEGHGRQILTGESGMDGFYYARLAKTAL